MTYTSRSESRIDALAEHALTRAATGEPAYLIGTAAAPVGELAAALRRKVAQRGLRLTITVDGDIVEISGREDSN